MMPKASQPLAGGQRKRHDRIRDIRENCILKGCQGGHWVQVRPLQGRWLFVMVYPGCAARPGANGFDPSGIMSPRLLIRE